MGELSRDEDTILSGPPQRSDAGRPEEAITAEVKAIRTAALRTQRLLLPGEILLFGTCGIVSALPWLGVFCQLCQAAFDGGFPGLPARINDEMLHVDRIGIALQVRI